MQVLPFMPSLELYPRNSLLFSSLALSNIDFADDVLIRFQPDGGGDFRPLPPGEGGVSPCGQGQRPC
jgi:hypothetical protein